MLDTTLKTIAAYCAGNVWEYEERFEMALNKMDYFRMPLKMADIGLYNDIADAVDDYCSDFGLDADEVDIEEMVLM